MTTSAIVALLEKELPGFSADNAVNTFAQFGIDSFGMLELRVAIEHATGRSIPDAIWVQLRTPAQLLAHLDGAPRPLPQRPVAASLRRQYALNMPQMALGGLSEAWLFKELGDAHWSMITAGLGAASSSLRDGNGDRLYATITRIRVESSAPMVRFEENEGVTLEGRISRFGAGLFFSEFTLAGAGKTINAAVMSSFAKRGSPMSNASLLKGQPAIPTGCLIPDVASMPEFGLGYRDRRIRTLAPTLFETAYEIVPYHDINWVGLLYFAAYPTISDICELKYVGRANQWAFEASTVSRDIFYFANSDAHDRLLYRVHAKEDTAAGVSIESSISRASDSALMAYIVTKKAVTRA